MAGNVKTQPGAGQYLRVVRVSNTTVRAALGRAALCCTVHYNELCETVPAPAAFISCAASSAESCSKLEPPIVCHLHAYDKMHDMLISPLSPCSLASSFPASPPPPLLRSDPIPNASRHVPPPGCQQQVPGDHRRRLRPPHGVCRVLCRQGVAQCRADVLHLPQVRGHRAVHHGGWQPGPSDVHLQPAGASIIGPSS